MSKIIYTVKQDAMGVDYIEGVVGDTVMIIPIDPANADYQRYLNPDKVEQSTEIVADETPTK